jgi:hypothetical protein
MSARSVFATLDVNEVGDSTIRKPAAEGAKGRINLVEGCKI